ncbi:MAG TPA: hypothetical protein DDX98_04740 [Bacteroidales bacterium]|nr:hypothetical protein [Bacteroidales bacterium]
MVYALKNLCKDRIFRLQIQGSDSSKQNYTLEMVCSCHNAFNKYLYPLLNFELLLQMTAFYFSFIILNV